MRPLREPVDWGIYLKLPISGNCRHEDFGKLCDIIASGHFGIISPHRSLAHHDDMPQRGMRAGGDREIFAGDCLALGFVDAEWHGHTRKSLSEAHNEKAWKKLFHTMLDYGCDPLPICGVFTEKGGQPTLEAAMVVSGPNLTREFMRCTARNYNQDSFIYVDGIGGDNVQMYEVDDRGPSGLPMSYVGSIIGHTKTAGDIQDLLGVIYA